MAAGPTGPGSTDAMMTSWETRNATNSGLSMVPGKNAHTRNAVRSVVTNSGIWLRATRSVSRVLVEGPPEKPQPARGPRRGLDS